MTNPLDCKYRVTKRYEDDESDFVKGDQLQYAVELWQGKVAGWSEITKFKTKEEACEWIRR